MRGRCRPVARRIHGYYLERVKYNRIAVHDRARIAHQGVIKHTVHIHLIADGKLRVDIVG